MINAVLFMRELASAPCALKGILLATLVFQVPIEVVVPVIRSLTMRTRVHAFGAILGHRFAFAFATAATAAPSAPFLGRTDVQFGLLEVGCQHGVSSSTLHGDRG